MSVQSAATEKWKELISQPTIVQVYVALAVLVATVLLFFFFRFIRQAKANSVVLAGLSGSGKTCFSTSLMKAYFLYAYKLRDGSVHQGSVTSMDLNEGTFILHSEADKRGKVKPVHVVDVPGNHRLRPKLDNFLQQAAGIVFVIDAVDFLLNMQAVAEYLYDILTKACVVKRRTPTLIVCNKTDKVTAHTKEFIRKQLEKELEKLRASRIAGSAADIANEVILGIASQPFTFSHCNNKVTVTDASGLTGEITEIEEFIRDHVKR